MSKNDITGDSLISKAGNKAFEDGWARIDWNIGQFSQIVDNQKTKFEPIFMHSFSNKEDIAQQFEIDISTLANCDILLAYYHCGKWGCDSSAFVLYEQDGKLYEVNGSHCSCYGLEGQWSPEETTIEALEHRLDHGSLGDVGGYDDEGYAKESKLVIDYLKGRNK